MHLNKKQLEAATYIFEKDNGPEHGEYEANAIDEAAIYSFSNEQLEKFIVDSLSSDLYIIEADRTMAYWALSKRFNKNLIPFFTERLAFELEKDCSNALFQLMIALDNLEEPVFNKDRSGYAFDEIELNVKDASHYLKSNHNTF